MTKRPNTVVGIDPSLTSTGVAVIRNGVAATIAVGSTRTGDQLAERLARIHSIVSHVVDVVAAAAPSLVAVEGYSFASKGRGLTGLIELGAILRYELAASFDVFEVAPAAVKKFATGKGAASKTDVALAVYKRWRFEAPTPDEVDAFVLAKIAEAKVGDADSLTVAQEQVIGKL